MAFFNYSGQPRGHRPQSPSQMPVDNFYPAPETPVTPPEQGPVPPPAWNPIIGPTPTLPDPAPEPDKPYIPDDFENPVIDISPPPEDKDWAKDFIESERRQPPAPREGSGPSRRVGRVPDIAPPPPRQRSPQWGGSELMPDWIRKMREERNPIAWNPVRKDV